MGAAGAAGARRLGRLLCVAAVAAAASASGGAPEGARPGAIHEVRVVVAGDTVRALCTGGERRVVLWHDEGGGADGWRPVLELLDGAVGACAFDRRGTGPGGSDPGERGWYELMDELRAIHRALGFERGYVLGAHGLGGLYARLYASDRPLELAGLVLVEPAHEDLPRRQRTGMPRSAWDAWMAVRARANADGVTERSVAARARRARLPDVPVTVVTGSIRRDGAGWDGRFLAEGARQAHASILSGVSVGRHVPAARSGRDAHLDEPGLVAAEILRVVGASTR